MKNNFIDQYKLAMKTNCQNQQYFNLMNIDNLSISNNQLINMTFNNTKIPKLELEILLANILDKDRVHLKAHPEMLLLDRDIIKFYELVNRRLQGEPIAYIIENKNFWDFNLLINKNVLIPRSDTELLVEKTLEILEYKLSYESKPIRILELGTGSGAISLAIAKSYPTKVEIIATDISIDALKVAILNANRLKIDNVKFLHGNWFSALERPYISSCHYDNNSVNNIFKFDFIISNPPYIALEEIHLCDFEVFFEPKIALFADKEGLDSLEHIIIHSKNYLNDSGTLLIEHGAFQKSQVTNFFVNAHYNTIKSYQDLSGMHRVIVGN